MVEFSYIAHNKTSAILTMIIIEIVQHGHSRSDAHKPLDPWNVDGDHYVNDGDPQEGVRRLVPLCGRFTRRCKACPSPCKTSGPCLQYPSSILSIGCRQVSKLISYTWFAMQGMFIVHQFLQNIRSVSAAFESFRHILCLLVADVNSRVSNPIPYTWVAMQGLSTTLKPAGPPAL